MSNLLHPYKYWQENGQYFFDAPSGAKFVAYFLDLSSVAENLYTFNFDRVREKTREVVDKNVFDTICSILEGFFKNHINAIIIVCDSVDGREEARMRLFNSWFIRMAPPGFAKVDRIMRAESYRLFVSLLIWEDNPQRDSLLALLEEYWNAMLL